MKTFKLIDIIISLVLMITLSVWSVLNDNDLEIVIESYCIIGAWQSISMITHECMKWFAKAWNTRRAYHITSLILLITIPAGSVWVLVFTAGPMALFYTGMCITEYRKIQIVNL